MPDVAEIYESMEYGPAPESAGPAEAWLEARGRAFGLFVGGRWTEAAEETFEVHRPSDGSVLATATQAGEEDVDAAVRAAREAFPAWAARSGHERARVLYALARRVQRHARLFAVLESMDNGKPIRESRDLDIPLVARHFYHHAGWAQLRDAEFPDRVPVGVVGQVIPWNFPLLMLSWKVAPALAAGNTLVLKPAEFTPLTALLFAELCADAGVPPGVVNVITGDGRTGEALVRHPDVDKVAFTGSTEVGRRIRDVTAGSGKKLSLELGGKSPFVVFDDADLDSVVEGVVDAIWFNQGQVCCAGSRILVHEGVAERLEAGLRRRMETLRMGDPLDKGVDMGAIVAPVQLERIRTLVEQGREEGARIWQPSWAAPEEGWFYPPTLCTDCSSANVLAREEVFGPVVTMSTFRTPDEAVELANDTRYGLAASVWTQDLDTALDLAPRIRAGTVWVNCTNLFDAAAGFGGYRESGYGREGGREGMEEYLRPDWWDDAPELPADPDGLEPTSGEAGPGRPADAGARAAETAGRPSLDRTPKLYVGGRQKRPDAEGSLPLRDADGRLLGDVPAGNRKDVRDAVEAAVKAWPKWAERPAHNRAQVLYYLAENLEARRSAVEARLAEVEGRLRAATPFDLPAPAEEVDLAVRRLFTWAAWADKWDGRVHGTPFRNVTLAMNEPVGVIGVVPPVAPALLGLVSTLGPCLATGNAVVALPSPVAGLLTAELYAVIDTSDVPGGVVNLVTGRPSDVVPTLAAHDAVEGFWHFASVEGPAGAAAIERLSTGNMKRVWTDHGRARDWTSARQGEGEAFLRAATHVKNVWVPYGA